MLSTLHAKAAIGENKKKIPETVKCYYETKYSVNVVYQMARKYTVKTMTRRWPIHSFQNTLDLAAINAWVLYKEINDTKIPRRYFLQNLAEELGMPFMRRISTPDASETVEEADQHQQETAKSRSLVKNTVLADATIAENLCVENVLQAQSACTQAVGLVDD